MLLLLPLMIIVLVMVVVLSDEVATSGDHFGPRDIAEDAARPRASDQTV